MYSVKEKRVRCFLHVARVGPRFVSQLIARGTGTDIYVSKTCDTEDEAKALAQKYLAKNKGVILT